MKYYTISTERDELSFTGRIIGKETSEDSRHSHREAFVTDVPARAGVKPSCSACRWFEITLYTTDDGRYVVHTVGRSVIPGEIDLGRIATTTSAHVVVDLLTVRKPHGESFLPAPSSRALATAARDDEAIEYAYVNRAVV